MVVFCFLDLVLISMFSDIGMIVLNGSLILISFWYVIDIVVRKDVVMSVFGVLIFFIILYIVFVIFDGNI